ncbi:MAG: hypothetical protein WC882_01345 [Candidatus Gracilibacteria bacterium]
MERFINIGKPNKLEGTESVKMEFSPDHDREAVEVKSGLEVLKGIKENKELLTAVFRSRETEVDYLNSMSFRTQKEARDYLESRGFSLLAETGLNDEFMAVFRMAPCAVLAGRQSDGSFLLSNVAIVGIHTGKLGVTDGDAAVFLRKHKIGAGSKCIRSLRHSSQPEVTV